MQRSLTLPASALLAAFMLLTAGAAAANGRSAAPRAPCEGSGCEAALVVTIDPGGLATPGQRAVVARRLQAAAEAYCRANPMEATPVAACRRALTAELIRDLAARTGVALDGTRATQLAHN